MYLLINNYSHFYFPQCNILLKYIFYIDNKKDTIWVCYVYFLIYFLYFALTNKYGWKKFKNVTGTFKVKIVFDLPFKNNIINTYLVLIEFICTSNDTYTLKKNLTTNIHNKLKYFFI